MSSVVLEMTRDVERASSTVRFTLSPDTSVSQLEYTVKVIKEHLEKSKIN